MGSYVNTLKKIRKNKFLGYWGERIISQLQYAGKLSAVSGNQYDGLLNDTTEFVYKQFEKDGGVITRDTAMQAEEMLAQLSEPAKRYRMICAAHAHIDMNWMWPWYETVSVTLDTFRTMLDLMEEYPEFKFSQSQASVYKILEEYAPDMLEEVKKRVKEGRWEVTASTWVEADKNMPNGESMARHILYTKKYLSDLLEIDPDTLNLDFEPDTFGHSLNIPEILSSGGVKYYYHCRGDEGHYLYNWKAPSGKSVITYREPLWYNAEITPSMALYVPEFCSKHGINAMLKVYGVGDHGGGPTRRDLDRIIDMDTWPVFPEIKFGTFKEFFAATEDIASRLPVVEGELNFVFSGCYTSQSRIKLANRVSEESLHEAEGFNSIANLALRHKYDGKAFEKAWCNTLFNQFHDIIPGSGTVDTREYAMGLFQDTLAIANSRKAMALQAIASQIDTSHLIDESEGKDLYFDTSEGAGVGFGVESFKVTQSHRGRGKTRIFHIFNPSPAKRNEAAEIVVWDWHGELDRIVFRDHEGNRLKHQLLDHGFNNYWGHKYLRVLVQAKVPGWGYTTVVMTEDEADEIKVPYPLDPRVEKVDEFVLENDFVRVVFDRQNASIVSLVDKSNGEEYIKKGEPAGVIRLVQEDPSKGMTAWVVGRYMDIQPLTQNLKVKKVNYSGDELRQSIAFEVAFGSSSLKAVVSLDYDSPRLDYRVECDWHEIGKPDKSIPQLNFYMPLGYQCSAFKYDIPFGVVEREGMDMDVPGNSWVLGARDNKDGKSLMIITGSKYGFRCVDNTMSVTLIRSSFDPDPYPELGIHKFNFAVYLTNNSSNKDLIQLAHNYNHPLSVISDKAGKGTLPAAKSFMVLESGDVALSAIKMPEDGTDRLVIRAYEAEGRNAEAVLRFSRRPKKAYYIDLNEKEVATGLKVSTGDEKVVFEVPAFSVVTLCIEFE